MNRQILEGNMNKIIFIEPQPPNLHIFSKFKSPRLGLFILGTMMKKRGWQVEIFVEDMVPLDWDCIGSATLVGISSITSTAPRAYKIAQKIKEMGIPVLMGGPHPTFLADEALEYCDYVIRGEGERALTQFIDAWEKEGDFSSVANLSYKSAGKVIHNPMGLPIENLDTLPYPDFTLFKGHHKILGPGKVVPIQTSRGCPYSCSFCSVTSMFGRKYRFRSIDSILGELKKYRSQKHFIFFYDDNFTANPGHTRQLLEAIIDRGLKFKWSAQVRVDAARDRDLVGLMKAAGCHTVFIGLESFNPDSLSEMKKNQKVTDIYEAIDAFREEGIHIHGMFVLGSNRDNWKTVRETVRFAKKSRITSAQFLILTPLPGSELYNNLKLSDRILFKDWSLYDAHHVVFKPQNFSLPGLQWAQIYSHKKFYSRLQRYKKLVIGNLTGFFINFYANQVNRLWKKKNKTFLKVLQLLKPNQDADIIIDYREKIRLDFPPDTINRQRT